MDALVHMDDFVKQLRVIVKFFRNRNNLNRFIETCVRDSDCEATEGQLKDMASSLPALAEWRWLIYAKVIAALLKKEDIIRECWDPERFKGDNYNDNAQAPNRSDEDLHVDLDDFSAIVDSQMFWSYAAMIVHLLSVFRKAMIWSEACSCHFKGCVDIAPQHIWEAVSYTHLRAHET